MPQYQIPPQQDLTAYRSDQHPSQYINHALQHSNALQQPCLNQDAYENRTLFEGNLTVWTSMARILILRRDLDVSKPQQMRWTLEALELRGE